MKLLQLIKFWFLTFIVSPFVLFGMGESIFDGKTLNGWKSPDMSYWSVEDGAITAQSSESHPCKYNQFIVWQGGDVADFVLTFQYKIEGSDKANSGVQFRSQLEPDGHAVGYQADITRPVSKWLGSIYDEKGRKTLARRGHLGTIDKEGNKSQILLSDPDRVIKSVTEGWNNYRITAIGHYMKIEINNQVTSEVIDHDVKDRDMKGILALQLHSGPAMKVQFKNLKLTVLKVK